MEPVFPHTPIDAFQASGRAANVTLTAQILPGDFLTITGAYDLKDAVCFFEFAKT
jgi:hypothetical protein